MEVFGYSVLVKLFYVCLVLGDFSRQPIKNAACKKYEETATDSSHLRRAKISCQVTFGFVDTAIIVPKTGLKQEPVNSVLPLAQDSIILLFPCDPIPDKNL